MRIREHSEEIGNRVPDIPLKYQMPAPTLPPVKDAALHRIADALERLADATYAVAQATAGDLYEDGPEGLAGQSLSDVPEILYGDDD